MGYARICSAAWDVGFRATGSIEWRIAERMNTEPLNAFLQPIARAHASAALILVLEGAPSRRGAKLAVPDDMRRMALPPHSPALNPAELLRDEAREREFAAHLFAPLPAAVEERRRGLRRPQRRPKMLQSLTGWNWIIRSL